MSTKYLYDGPSLSSRNASASAEMRMTQSQSIMINSEWTLSTQLACMKPRRSVGDGLDVGFDGTNFAHLPSSLGVYGITMNNMLP